MHSDVHSAGAHAIKGSSLKSEAAGCLCEGKQERPSQPCPWGGGERRGRPEEVFAAGSNGNQGWPCPSHHIRWGPEGFTAGCKRQEDDTRTEDSHSPYSIEGQVQCPECTARQAGAAARRWQWWWELTLRGCCFPILSHMFFVGGVGWGGVAVQGQVGSTIAFRDVWGGAAWQCPGRGYNTQLPEDVPGDQRLRVRTVAIVVHLDCRLSEPWYFPFKHYARAQAPGPPALECHCDCW